MSEYHDRFRRDGINTAIILVFIFLFSYWMYFLTERQNRPKGVEVVQEVEQYNVPEQIDYTTISRNSYNSIATQCSTMAIVSSYVDTIYTIYSTSRIHYAK